MRTAVQAMLNLEFPLIAAEEEGALLGLSPAAEALLGGPLEAEAAPLDALLGIEPGAVAGWLEAARRGTQTRLQLPGGLQSAQLLVRAAPLAESGQAPRIWVLGLHPRESVTRQRFEREILLRIGSLPITELMAETMPLTREEPARSPITNEVLQMIQSYLGGRCVLMLRGKGLARLGLIGQAGLDADAQGALLDDLEHEQRARALREGIVGEGEHAGLVFTVSATGPGDAALAAIAARLPFPCREIWVDGIGGFGAALTFFDTEADAALRPFATEAYVRLGRHLESAGFSRDLFSAYQALQEAQERIIQAGRLAALGEIAAGIAHELRQPVTAINNFVSNVFTQVETGKFDRLSEKVQDYRERSRRNVDRLMGIIDHLRTFSRDDSVRFERVDLLEMLAEIRDTFFHQDRTLRRHVPMEWQLPATLPMAEVDPRRIEQVILNLVSNAADAVDGRPEARIVVGAEADAAHVRLFVADNGPGISEAERKRIFDPFFTTKPAGKGTGIGLSISHGIVKGHNGEILVERNEGGGATFSVILPIHQPETGHPDGAEARPEAGPGPG